MNALISKALPRFPEARASESTRSPAWTTAVVSFFFCQIALLVASFWIEIPATETTPDDDEQLSRLNTFDIDRGSFTSDKNASNRTCRSSQFLSLCCSVNDGCRNCCITSKQSCTKSRANGLLKNNCPLVMTCITTCPKSTLRSIHAAATFTSQRVTVCLLMSTQDAVGNPSAEHEDSDILKATAMLPVSLRFLSPLVFFSISSCPYNLRFDSSSFFRSPLIVFTPATFFMLCTSTRILCTCLFLALHLFCSLSFAFCSWFTFFISIWTVASLVPWVSLPKVLFDATLVDERDEGNDANSEGIDPHCDDESPESFRSILPETRSIRVSLREFKHFPTMYEEHSPFQSDSLKSTCKHQHISGIKLNWYMRCTVPATSTRNAWWQRWLSWWEWVRMH